MRTLNKIKIAIAALFVGLLCSSPLASLAQNENGVTDQGESTTKVNSSYVNENGKFVCWPRVSPNGKLLTYGPVVTTDSVNSITSTTAVLYGNVVHDGWCGVTEQGFEVSSDANFTTIVATVVMNPQPSFTPCIYPACLCAGNEYHKEVTGLTAGTHYYYRAYAENPCDPDPSYGDTLEFDTPGAGYVVEVTGPSPVQFCPGGSQSATYTASVTPAMTTPTYQWYLDGALVAGETSSTFTTTFSVTGTHAVKCEITEGGSTVDGTKSVTVSAYTVPALAIDAPDDPICAGATGNLTATAGFDIYGWSANVASSSTNTATYTAAGTYSVTASDSHGCSATANKTVTVTDPQVASATGITGNTTICSGSTTILTANATASTGATLHYQWKKNGTAISGATGASYTTEALTANTSYSCDVTAVQDGCTSAATTLSAAVTIEESTLASVSIAPATQTICAGETATMTANAGSYNGTLSYQWKQGTTNVGTNNASYTTGALSATTTYTCVVTNTTTHGCVTSLNANATVTVTTPAVAISSITASPSTICVGETATLTPAMGSYTGTLSYAWSTGATTASLTTGAINAATTYTLTVTATSGSCTATATKSITVTPTNTSATTNVVASVTCVSATLQGVNTACSDGRGFVYSATNSTPTVGGTGCTDLSVPNGTGNFSYALTGLTPNTTYYVRAYSHSAGGYVYGSTVRNFTTSAINVNVVAQNGQINLCVVPNQTTVNFEATPSCDADNAGSTYTWSLDPVYPYTQSADGKTITVTVSSSTAIDVTATCTLHHVSGYTNSGSDYSIISVVGNPPEICVCEDSYNGIVALTNPPAAQISSIVWQQQGGAGHSTSTVGMNISDPATPEGYYDVTITNTYGCQATREVVLGFPFNRCNHITPTGATTETEDANGVWQITDGRTANGNSATTYRVVQIGSQCWMAENLRYKQEVDGFTAGISRPDLVNQSIYTYRMYFTWPDRPNVRPLSNGTTWGAAELTSSFGYLYTWVGAMDMPATMQTRGTIFPPVQRDFHVQGVCPDGWHLPTDGEWFQLEHFLGVPQSDSAVVSTCIREDNEPDYYQQGITRGNSNYAGTAAATGCVWYQNSATMCPQDYCSPLRNTCGFSGVPSGVFVPQYDDLWQCFQLMGQQGNYWSASQAVNLHLGHDDFSDAAYTHHLIASKQGWGRYRADKHNGLSVRCVRDMVTTADATNVTTSTATLGGSVLEDAGYTITERGICWSTTGTPSISGNHQAVGSGVGSFSTTINLTAGNVYQYCAYAVNSEGVYYGLTKTVEPLSRPAVNTGKYSDIDAAGGSVHLHGEVIRDGGYAATTRGICWGTNANPTIADSHLDATGLGMGAYEVTATSLSASTTYHYRAYATNPQGTEYGEDKTFSLRPCGGATQVAVDGANVTISEIGSQCWTSSLYATHYADGTAIPRGCGADGSTSAFQYADILPYYYQPYTVSSPEGDAAARVTTYGRLYNWAAATRGETGSNVQGICPNGWHIPTMAEFQTLMTTVGNQYASGIPYAYLVCANNTWTSSTVTGSPGAGTGGGAAVPRSDFRAYPVGILHPNLTTLENYHNVCNFWCADAGTYPYFTALVYDNPAMSYSNGAANYNAYAFSVRCVKD